MGKRRAEARPTAPPPPWVRVPSGALVRSRLVPRDRALIPNPFDLPKFPPGVRGRAPDMAMDDQIVEVNAWAAQGVYNAAYFEGVTFLGYTYLSELAQRPEYRRISEVLATAATSRWIKFRSTATAGAGDERIKQLEAEFTRLDVKGAMRRLSELDGFFGRSHLYLDTGDTEDREELRKPIGDGSNRLSLAKFRGRKGFLERIKTVEPVWCYPAFYNANDPLRPDWYKPQSWYVQGKQVHASRLLTLVAREVPDLLKPSYSFGGLSLSQMAKPYVDNWIRTRQSVADLIWSFSVSVISTDLANTLAGDGQEFWDRLEILTNVRNNRGILALQNGIEGTKEDFKNISTPLGTLDALQAQAQEHMCSVTGTPVVVLLGIQPAGLNASSQGEIDVWKAWVAAYQEAHLRDKVERVMRFAQLSLWGAVDPEITFAFEPLTTLDAVQLSQILKTKAETDDINVAMGAVSPLEVRKRLAADPDSQYQGLDVDDLPEPEVGPKDIDITGTKRPANLQAEPGTPRPNGELH